MSNPKKIAILHYAAPPVIGGVESVLEAHANLFIQHGYAVTVISGRGAESALPDGVKLICVPLIDSQHPQIIALNQELETGVLPAIFDSLKQELVETLKPLLSGFDAVIVHNIFTKHFNLPLTAALFDLLDQEIGSNWIAWSHDFTWTSPNSAHKVFPKYPWDLLRSHHPRLQHVVVSQARQQDLAELYQLPPETIQVVYNGVDPQALLGLSPLAMRIVSACGLNDSDLTLLMPVRVTQAKNIEFALDTLAALKQASLNPKLILTGPPDPHDPQNMAYFEALRQQRDQLGLQEHFFFVYELGDEAGQPLTLSMDVVGELFRVADGLLMPSHREGFGMPILEAGLCGLAVFSAPIPASVEIGQQDIHTIDIHKPAADTAQQIIAWANASQTHHMRRKVRQSYTWEALFHRQIKPLVESQARR